MVKRKQDKLKLKLYHFKSAHKRRGFEIDASYDELLFKLKASDGRCDICCKSVGIYNLTGDMINPSRKKVHSIDDIQFIIGKEQTEENQADSTR